MENTCALTVLPVIPNWKIYNSVPRKTVKYCAILKERREFQYLLENVIFSKTLEKSCSIIDKKIDASKNKNSLDIVFLNLKGKDLLSLCLTVSKKHLSRQRNNLLIFLKNNANNLKYHVQDDSIYVKCDANIQWHIFYNLFEFLFVRYGLCNIGSMFYCSLFSDGMLKQEQRFLCYNSIDANSTSSLLSSHKIAVNISGENLDLVCRKLTKRALCSQNYSETFVAVDSQNFPLKILSDSIPNKNSDTISNFIMPKRKRPKLDCFCSKMFCKCHESKWQLHKNIYKYNVSCYMDILLKKGVTSTDELSISQGDLQFNSTFDNFSSQNYDSSLNVIENSVQSVNLLATKKDDLSLGGSQIGKKCSGYQHGNSTRNTVSVLANTSSSRKFKPKPESLLKAINLLNADMDEKENFSFLFGEFSEKETTISSNASKIKSGKNEEFDKFPERETFANSTAALGMFQTASGKKIDISDTALKAAEKMFTEVMQPDEKSFSVNNKSTQNGSNREETAPSFIVSSVCESTNQTEAGKDKQLNENIDEMLVDNFFEDICFDEKEGSSTGATQSSSLFTDKFENSSSVGKVRKRLGGRRSLKPFSIPKSR